MNLWKDMKKTKDKLELVWTIEVKGKFMQLILKYFVRLNYQR